MSCATSCPTKDHATFGECLRSQKQMIGYANSANGMDLTQQKRWDKDLDFYKNARAQGVQPAGTKRVQVERALEISNATGKAYDAG